MPYLLLGASRPNIYNYMKLMNMIGSDKNVGVPSYGFLGAINK